MPHRKLWLSVLTALVALVACLGVFLSARDSSNAAREAARRVDGASGPRAEPTAEVPLSRFVLPGSGVPGAPPAGTEGNAGEPRETPVSLRGRLVFLDGSPVPLQLVELSPEPAATTSDAARRSEATDGNGDFEFRGLHAGNYRLRLAAGASIVPEDTLQAAPGENLLLRVDGCGLLVKCVDAAGESVSGAAVQLFDPQPRGSSHSDDLGLAAFVIADPTTCDVKAVKGPLSGTLAALSLPGEADLSVRELVLLRPAATGRLDVRVRSKSGIRLQDFSVRLLDAELRTQVRFLRSMDADSDGTFGDIPAGTYLASLAPAYLGAPELYTKSRQREPVTVTEGMTTIVQFEVELCGRVLLRIDKPGADPQQRATVSVRDRDGHTRSLSCRIPGPDETVEVTGDIPLNTTFVVDEILPDGSWTIFATLPDHAPSETTILVTSGLVTQATLRL